MMTTMTMTMTTMTDRTVVTPRTKKAHRAAGSRKVVAALSTAATAGLMFAMATAEPAWTADTAVNNAPDEPIQTFAAPASRLQLLLPVPPASDGSLVAPATPQPVQLDPVAAPTRVVTKTVVVQRGGGSATTKSSGSR
jgi:hypothetical protein